MVFTRKYWCGKTGAQPRCGSRGRKFGSRPPPPSSWVRSRSANSSYSTTVPPVEGQDPAVQAPPPSVVLFTRGGDSLRLKLTSYQSPAVMGEPPVTSEERPGKESDGCDVDALVYVLP